MALDDSLEVLAERVRRAPSRCGTVRLVCVDGPAGSGKSTLAGELAGALGARVVAMDDLYEGWEQPLGGPLSRRVEAWLLLAWAAGLPGQHLCFDWGTCGYTRWVVVPPDPVIVLEGCGSAAALIRARAALVIWVEAPPGLRLERGIRRDGGHLAAQWRAWQAHEQEHFAADGTRAAADVIVDGRQRRIIGTAGGPRS